MEREFGPISRRLYRTPAPRPIPTAKKESPERRKNVWIIDGYNVIFAWEGLGEVAETDLEGARICLMDLLSNYAGYTGSEVVLVV